MISAGDSHSLFCNSQNGVVYITGVYRNLFKGNMSPVFRTPVRLGEKEFQYQKIDKMISGVNHSFVLINGRVFAWGDPECGVLARRPSVRRKFEMGLMIMQIPAKNISNIFTAENSAFYTKLVIKNNI